ncbi:superoxide dismutase family protein [Sphingobium aquiterrae]|uniref:superoxide dismutase family protein n=1 Tax=Sphingobium aquiterrae TaxID=2038656 RepID=UPI00301910E0
MTFPKLVHLSLLAPAALLAGCATASGQDAAPRATASLLAADGTPRGTVAITQDTHGLEVTVKALGVTPGVHAVHIHTTGMCVAPDFTSAGGHWNPTGKHHGSENPQGMHMGDMPNMTVGADGTGTLTYTIAGGMLTGGATPLLDADGAAAVIHAGPDDMKSDPAGNAGGRIACGVLSLG